MISVSNSPCSPTVYWIDSLKLFPFDQQRLLEGEQLNASILMAVATIYCTQFPELPPIQDPAYVLNLKKKVPSSTLGEQLAALYGHVAVGGEFTVHQQQVQVQSGSTDCGLFTIAFATSILLGDEPATLQYNQKEMRGHLAYCLENELMTPFPAVVKRTRRWPQPLQLKLKL